RQIAEQYTCFKRVFKKVKISFLLTKTGKKIHVEGVVGQNVLKVASENDVGIHAIESLLCL
ncbi:hypothetical protein TNCT_172681, partial [Trichonephila clavata]